LFANVDPANHFQLFDCRQPLRHALHGLDRCLQFRGRFLNLLSQLA